MSSAIPGSFNGKEYGCPTWSGVEWRSGGSEGEWGVRAGKIQLEPQ